MDKKFRFTNGNELHVTTTEGGGLRLEFLRYRPDSTFSHLSPGLALEVAAALVAGVEEIKRRSDTCQGCLERLPGHTIDCST